MATIVTRASKGDTLTFTEADANFDNLNAVASDTLVTAKGDLIAATASGAVDNLAVGTNGKVLTADSTAATGMSWQTPAATAAAIVFTPNGSIAATDVQAAIVEVRDEAQPLDAELTAIAGLTSAADKGIQFTGSGTAAMYDLTTAGKALLDDANAAAQLVTLGLTASAAELNIMDGVTATAAELSKLAGTPAGLTSTEIGYLDGVTSSIQTQLDNGSISTATFWDALGDLAVGTGSNTASRLAVGTDGYVLTADSGEATGLAWNEPGTTSIPTVQTFTSGSGTYTKPAGCTRIVVKMVGGGGGGGGSGTASTGGDGGTGGTTTFGTSLLTCVGGSGGIKGSNADGGGGGTATINAPAIGIAMTGGSGDSSHLENETGVSAIAIGGRGGDTALFGGGAQRSYSAVGVPNSGGGGAGGSTNGADEYPGGGGGGGGSIEAIIAAPASSYAYAVGAAGAAGSAGTSGNAAGTGAAGKIVVFEFYGNFDSVLQLNEPASTKQEFTSGSGTYTTPAGVNRIRVRMVGAGGGGGPGAASTTPGATGGTSTFGSSLLTCVGGSGGAIDGTGASGGTATVSAPAVGVAIVGSRGDGARNGTNVSGGQGGDAPYFGGSGPSAYTTVGAAGQTNSGAGGGGGGAASGSSGAGGGSGGFVDAWIWSPSATYAYAVGAGGTAGDGTLDGGAGAAGRIIVEEFYGPTNTVADTVPLGGYARNKLHNGDFSVAQRGTSFTSATNPANSDDKYLLDRWTLLSDGNDIVDVTQNTAAAPGLSANGSLNCIALDCETVNKKFGIIQFVEQKDCQGLIGGAVTLSFKCKVSATTKFDNIKAAIITWDSTADTVTSDVVSAWGVEGTDPTLVANWTYDSAPANLGVTTNWATYTVAGNIDTASAANVAVFIWSDVTDTTLGDFIYITDVQLEAGSVRTQFDRINCREQLENCRRFAVPFDDACSTSYTFGGAIQINIIDGIHKFNPPLRIAPSTIENNNLTTWDGDGAPVSGSCSAYSMIDAGWATITGAFSVAFVNATTKMVAYRFTAGTSFSAGADAVYLMACGGSPGVMFSADL